MKEDHSYSEQWHNYRNLFKHFQEYLGIFRDIDAYLATFIGVQLG